MTGEGFLAPRSERRDIWQSGAAKACALCVTASVQTCPHGAGCQQWECFKAFAADVGESQEDVQGVERCVTLIAVFRSWVRVAEKWFLGSLASVPPS